MRLDKVTEVESYVLDIVVQSRYSVQSRASKSCSLSFSDVCHAFSDRLLLFFIVYVIVRDKSSRS